MGQDYNNKFERCRVKKKTFSLATFTMSQGENSSILNVHLCCCGLLCLRRHVSSVKVCLRENTLVRVPPVLAGVAVVTLYKREFINFLRRFHYLRVLSHLQDVVPRGQSAVASRYGVPDDLLDDNVPQGRVFAPHDAEAQLLVRLLSQQLHHVGLGHQAGPLRGVVCRDAGQTGKSLGLVYQKTKKKKVIRQTV